MFDFKVYEKNLVEKIGEKRFQHSVRVVETALKLNTNIDPDKIIKAAILHDCAKYNEEYYYNKYKDKYFFDEEIVNNKAVFHAFLGSIVAKEEYNIKDSDILDAIRYHTTGRENMTDFDKIIFLADAIEPKRDYPGVDTLRKLAEKDLNEAVLFSLEGNIRSLLDRKMEICLLTIKARNFLIKEQNE